MNILITGANSFIGLPLLKKLIKNNNITIIIRKENEEINNIISNNKNIKVIYSSLKSYNKIVLPKDIDISFLLSWEGTRGSLRLNEKLQKSNYIRNLEFAKKLITNKCKKIVLAGSQAEYGEKRDLSKIKELNECNPNTSYGYYKLKLYETIKKYSENTNTVIYNPRFFSLFGPNDYKNTLVSSVLYNRSNTLSLSSCNQIWDYLYVDDAIYGLLIMIKRGGPGIYNFGSGYSKILKEYVYDIYDMLGRDKSGLIFDESNISLNNINPDISKLLNLGWYPKVTFYDGINIILKNLNNNFS